MKEKEKILVNNLEEAIQQIDFQLEDQPILINFTNNWEHGDIYTNIALQLASKYKKNPYNVAEKILKNFKKPKYISKVVAEKNGFINFFLDNQVFSDFYQQILKEKEFIGSNITEEKNWYFIEIASANPTGLLHIGHARNAIFSDTLANLLEYCGNLIHREYLINDMGNQIKELIESVWKKYIYHVDKSNFTKLKDISYNSPEVDKCAETLSIKFKDKWAWYDRIEDSKHYQEFKDFILNYFLQEIKIDLEKYNIPVKSWKSESSFVNDQTINNLLKSIKKYLITKEGAILFKLDSLIKGQKDEVLIKRDGKHTYFTQDMIYHTYKLSLLNKNGKIVNVLGSDHYGHIDRMKGFFKSQNISKEKIHFIPLQLVKLSENNEVVKISKRNSQIINLRELSDFLSYEEVRWFFVSQSPDSQIEIELEKIKAKDYNNPVFYVMYGYSRISKLLKKYGNEEDYQKKISFNTIKEGKEKEILNSLIKYPSTLRDAANSFLPHKIPQYLFELSKNLHSFYSDDENNLLKNKTNREWLIDRLALLNATKYIIKSGLSILKIETKDEL